MKMGAFESWQAINMTIQSVLLLAAFLGALYVGLKQNQINENLLEFQYQPSVEIGIQNRQVQVMNKGNHNIWLWGILIEGAPKDDTSKSMLITPHGFYYIPIEGLERHILNTVGENGEIRLNASTFISTIGDRYYEVKNTFYCIVIESNVTINCQTTAILKTDDSFKTKD